jgi:hypothetical protein
MTGAGKSYRRRLRSISQPLPKKSPYLLCEHASRKRVTSGNTLVSITLRWPRFFAAETRKRIFATIRCVPYSSPTSWVGIMRRCLVLIVPLLFVSAIADAARADDWQDGYDGCQKIYNAKSGSLAPGWAFVTGSWPSRASINTESNRLRQSSVATSVCEKQYKNSSISAGSPSSPFVS